jgi:hypothetical protein
LKGLGLNTSLYRNLLNTFQSGEIPQLFQNHIKEKARLEPKGFQGSGSRHVSAIVNKLEHLSAHQGSHLAATPHTRQAFLVPIIPFWMLADPQK